MKTLGFLRDNLFYLRILTITMASSIALQTVLLAKSTSEENTSGRYESLEVKLGGLEVRATGKNTTEVLMNLMRKENSWGIMHSRERF